MSACEALEKLLNDGSIACERLDLGVRSKEWTGPTSPVKFKDDGSDEVWACHLVFRKDVLGTL